MESNQYLDRLLLRYSGTFNIYKPYRIAETDFSAYGYFYNHIEKYVLTRDANLWSSDSYEHILFMETDNVSIENIEKIRTIISDYMEPEMVRKGEKYPGKNHMYSYLSVIFISKDKPDKKVIQAIRHFIYDKGYLFNMRGYSQAQLGLVCMEDESIFTNRTGRKKKTVLREVFKEVKENKIGFDEMCERQNIQISKQ